MKNSLSSRPVFADLQTGEGKERVGVEEKEVSIEIDGI